MPALYYWQQLEHFSFALDFDLNRAMEVMSPMFLAGVTAPPLPLGEAT